MKQRLQPPKLKPPKKGKGSSGLGSGMLDDAARKIKDRNKKLKEAANGSK